MDRTTKFEKELASLLEKYRACISFTCGENSDLTGVYDKRLVVTFASSSEESTLAEGYHLQYRDLQTQVRTMAGFSKEVIEYAEDNGITKDSVDGWYNWETKEAFGFIDSDEYYQSYWTDEALSFTLDNLADQMGEDFNVGGNMPTEEIMESFANYDGDLNQINWMEIAEAFSL